MLRTLLLASTLLALPIAAHAQCSGPNGMNTILNCPDASGLQNTDYVLVWQNLLNSTRKATVDQILALAPPAPPPPPPTFQGTLLDTLFQAGDADYGPALQRGCTQGLAMLLGPQTYPVSNFGGCNVPSFVLRGVPGKSIIQRQNANVGSVFFSVQAAYVYIDGVTFDSNKANVTANQWGVLLNKGGQTVNIRNSIFENNSGSLGSCFALLSSGPAAGGSFWFVDNEVTGCAGLNATHFTSVSNGLIRGNYIHDNTGTFGTYLGANGAVSSTNYLRNVSVQGNRYVRNVSGLSVGGLGPPYIYGTPPAVNVDVIGNEFVDNSSAHLVLQGGDFHTAIGNTITQTPTGPTPSFAILCNDRYAKILDNTVNVSGTTFTVDCGGSQDTEVRRNTVSATSGSNINIGGSINDTVRDNKLLISGTAIGITVFDVEGDGSGIGFPQHTSGLDIEYNTLEISGSQANGVSLYDDPGGFSGTTLPTIVKNNSFVGLSGAGSFQGISYRAGGNALQLGGNQWNNSSIQFVNPLAGNGDLVGDDVYDTLVTFTGAATTIRGVVSKLQETYGGGQGAFLWVFATTVGSGYSAATTLTAHCSTTDPTGTVLAPVISQGGIYGVRVNAPGGGCVGTPSVTATDPGGGSGAVFSISTFPQTLFGRQLTIQTNTVVELIQAGGGVTSLLPSFPVIIMPSRNANANLTGLGTNNWNVSQLQLPTLTTTTLPPNNNSTCTAAYNGAQVQVTNSATGKWLARCNGTNWLFPDGTTVN